MALQEIILHPDPHLRRIANEEKDASDGLRAHAADMLETMYAAKGIGLAAPQIRKSKRLIVMDCTPPDAPPSPIAMINPTIAAASEEMNIHEEGCLSIPEHLENIERPAEVTATWLDLDGNPREQDFTGLWATCLQHEIDHLNGRLFIDYLSALKRNTITRKMKKLKRELAR